MTPDTTPVLLFAETQMTGVLAHSGPTPSPAAGQHLFTATDEAFFSGEWLLRAADDEAAAQKAWVNTGVALLNCGTLFATVRMEAAVVWAAAGTDDLAKADRYLAGALFGGPVFMSFRPHRYYALVPVSAAEQYEWVPRRQKLDQRLDAKLLSTGSCITVPIPERNAVPDKAISYWSVPPRRDGELCSPHAVLQLLALGRYRIAWQGANEEATR
ncbi:hypothetical protein PV416_05225 [Streptomyces ipomoeae]|jgi:hypothetical protein|uniref:hypothetical protein n=1 Tax=Streptomyces ipomoeae TaxID=103232 RepID=UPI0029A3E0D2|nr:hypothetical protein [Streptomyces ipomoeae]MDX2820502.1 hypothetical protein [Streptomyces ipomoeae]MDX2875621.1 hypothetical protein [Streptomyces ipomoeae]